MDRRMKVALAVGLWVGPLLLGVAFGVWIVTATPPKEKKTEPTRDRAREDRGRLQGAWIGELLERDGKVVNRGAEARQARVRFAGDTAMFEENGVILMGSFRLDPTRTPKTFDLTVTDGDGQETYPAGIYHLTDDSFRLCLGFSAAKRPSEFATYPDSGRTLFVYRRAGSGVRLGSDVGRTKGSPADRGMQPIHSRTPIGLGMVRWTVPPLFGMAIMVAQKAPSPHAGGLSAKKTWDFEADQPGKIPTGFTNEVGRWEVAKHGDNHVLAQKAKNDDATFNVALVEGTNYKDLDLSVRLRAIAGKNDQGGGLVWRAKDKDNYYIARYNPLEDNLRVYKVEGGKRTQLDHADVPGNREWHTLRITMNGREILGYLDGKKFLVAEDSTFPEAGKIGLWSKSDAQSYFDDLVVSE
jgi:uncharacterized protein (TIGR03067 family)